MKVIFDILTLFPGYFSSPLEQSIIGKGIQKGCITVTAHNIRDFAEGKHRVTDDYPYGGGKGMVMKPEPIIRAIKGIKDADPKAYVILLTPQGEPFNQMLARELSGLQHFVLLCGKYEGVDERVRESVDREISIGDYILTGGEIAALVLIDAISRLIPGVLGNAESPDEDSFSQGLLEYPQYTRPREFEGMYVPDILLSGDHQAIAQWRREESLRRTLKRRPDLLSKADLSQVEREILEALKKSTKSN